MDSSAELLLQAVYGVISRRSEFSLLGAVSRAKSLGDELYKVNSFLGNGWNLVGEVCQKMSDTVDSNLDHLCYTIENFATDYYNSEQGAARALESANEAAEAIYHELGFDYTEVDQRLSNHG